MYVSTIKNSIEDLEVNVIIRIQLKNKVIIIIQKYI